MNRDQKATAVAEIATSIKDADAVFVVDYRGLSVPQAADLRSRLRAQDATLSVTKNTLVGRALDEDGVDAEALREHLAGPNALTYVRGDVAASAKVISDFAREHQLPQFKGGIVDGQGMTADDLQAIAKLPAREVLYGQLVGIVASPITGLARTLNALTSGLAVALGGVLEKKQSGEIPAGEDPVPAATDDPAPAAEADATETEAAPAADQTSAEADEAASADEPAAEATGDENEGGPAA